MWYTAMFTFHTLNFTSRWLAVADSSDFGLMGILVPQMRSLPRTQMNHRAKFDAAIALSSAEKSVTVQTQNYKQVRPSSGTVVYPHMPRARIAERRQ